MISTEKIISIPPVPEMRRHVLFSLNYVKAYLFFILADLISGDTDPEILNKDELEALIRKIMASDPDKPLIMTETEVKLIYASYVLGVKLILSDQGEYIVEQMLDMLPENYKLSFEQLREYILQVNSHLIKDAEENLGSLINDFKGWKKRLLDYQVDL